MDMINFSEVNCSYEQGNTVLEAVSLTVSEGEKIGLIGANGAGKSTLMKALLGLLPFSGNISVEGIPVDKKNIAAVRKKLGFVLQNSDNQMFMPTVYDDMKFGPMNYGATKEEADAKIDEVLKQLGIEELKHKYNHKISGGEKRMAAIATVLAMEPDILVLDEPSVSLDPYNRRKVIKAIGSLNKTMLIASHDLDMILELCDRVILISDGKVAADDAADIILSNRELLEQNRLELPLSRQKL